MIKKEVGSGIPFARKAPYEYEGVKYEADIKWAILNKSKFHTYAEWRQTRLREIGIVKSSNS